MKTNKEKLYSNIDYPLAWRKYEFHLKNNSFFVAYRETEDNGKWRLVESDKARYTPPFPEIDIKNEEVIYFLDLGDMQLWF